jgi:hypothetical protein
MAGMRWLLEMMRRAIEIGRTALKHADDRRAKDRTTDCRNRGGAAMSDWIAG